LRQGACEYYGLLVLELIYQVIDAGAESAGGNVESSRDTSSYKVIVADINDLE
jgi:hypothetical protein